MKRKDTKLESEGAEFLVLGNLLINGLNAYKAYVNYPGYDIIATSVDNNKICKIQVKSRWATDYDKMFPIKNLDSDFVIHVALNRGYSFRKIKSISSGKKQPQFYIIPTNLIEKYRRESAWNKVKITDIPGIEELENNWELISDFLRK